MSPAMTPWRGALKRLVRSMQSSTTQAIFGGGPVEGYPLDRFRQMFETNTLGALRVIQAVLPAWRKRGSGVIVNVSSVSGRVSSPLEAAYSASKFALEALTESLHLRSPSLWNTLRVNRARSHRYWHQSERAS